MLFEVSETPHRRRRTWRALALAAAATAIACPALAATASTTFTVTAWVQATCSISASNLAFGAYTGAVVNGSTTLSVTCTNATPYNVGLNAGTGQGATVTNRKMTSGGATLSYALYRDGGRTANWGATVGTDTQAGTGNGLAQTLTVYGRIPAGQSAAPGSYSDTITATITY